MTEQNIAQVPEKTTQMETWLIECGYSQEICLTTKQSIYGLYRLNVGEAKVHV